jgi:DegV family protein with EDD domain
MGRVRVVTDTTHYLPRALVEEHDLRQVSLYVRWQGRVDRESDLPDFDGFYDHLSKSDEVASTSQPSVGDFLEVYEPILDAGDDIVSVHLSGGISGTVRSAEQARDVMVERGIDPARVVIADSRTVAGGLGICLLGAAAAAEQGRSAEGCADAVQAVRDELKIWFAVDTLEFLRRGGRIGAAQAWVGAALKVKPILTLLDEVTPVERVRTSGRAFDRLVECLKERWEDGCDAFVVQHTQDIDRANRMVDAGREIFGTEPLFVSEIGPVIGTHGGPGLLGVAGIRRALVEAL